VSDFDERFDRLLREHVTRRSALQRGAYGAMSLSAMAYLAACGGDSLQKSDKENQAKVIPKGQISKTLAFSNWVLYIDNGNKPSKSATLNGFKKKYGTTVKYNEEINDNNEFFGKVRPQYAAGKSGGRDIHVVTDWMCNRMNQLGFVQKLDKSQMPNVTANIEPSVAHPDFDPNRDISVPWQSGQVVVIYRKDLTKGELTDYNDLLDPKFKGKVTMLTEMRDTVGAMLLAEGKSPEKATKQDCLAVCDKLEKLSRDGQIRRFTGNDYINSLPKGDTVACLGWSGDAGSLTDENKNIKYAQPDSGFMVFTDSMQVPVGAPHAFTAQKMMDYVYDPEVQATITKEVQYVPPVKGVADVIRKDDPATAENPLIFPDLSKTHNLKTFPRKDEKEIEAAFERATGA
jgi:spermidine/putrescine transport system substrate-binding protein